MQSLQRSTIDATRPSSSFSLAAQRAILIGHRIQVEKTLDAQMVNFGNPIVHAGAVGLEFVESVGHGILLGIFGSFYL